MNLSVYDKDLNRIAIIGNSFVSCLWSEGYNTMQNFSLELQATSEWKKKIKVDYYVGRMDRPTLMIIKCVRYESGKIVATGKQATRVLSDVAMVGTIASGSLIDKAIATAYNKSNKYRKLSVYNSNLGVRYDHQISNKSFLEVCNTMCQEKDMGYRIIRNNGNMLLQFYKQEENPNLIFSEVFGNLFVNSFTRSTETYKNYAVVLGEGEGNNRTSAVVDISAGEDHREIIIDAKDLQKEENESMQSYKNRLQARGVEKLLEHKKVQECAFTPIAKDFGRLFDLGDILTVNLPDYDMKIRSRVAKFTQKEQGNKTDTQIEVGEITVLR